MTTTKKQDMSYFSRRLIQPAADNNLIYDPFAPNVDNDDYQLYLSIKNDGIREPLHISKDNVLLSGHRRLSAAEYLDLDEVPVIIVDVMYYKLSPEERVKLLADYNRQRVKSHAERTREALLDIDPEEAYFELRRFRAEQDRFKIESNVDLGSVKKRAKITTQAFLDAAIDAVESERDYWPLTVRRVHYLLLNKPPLRHDKKPDSGYQNDLASYKTLTNLLLRARLAGLIPMQAIEDETRPISLLASYQNPSEYIKQEIEGFLCGYARDLMRGQAHHLEILCEKSAIRKHVEQVALEYGVPCTTGRGYASLTPRVKMVQRFRSSGKNKLILLVLSDFDPDGEQIAASFPQSLRDDFGIHNIQVSKVALTGKDVVDYNLPGDLEAKETSPNYRKFVELHGTHVAELDSCPVAVLQDKLRAAIESCLDMNLFQAELDAEKQDAAFVVATRRTVIESMNLLSLREVTA